MSTRKDSPRNRAYRPEPTVLEGRQLLSGVVTGTDVDGDTWTLRLIGPGVLKVTKQNDSTGSPAALSSPSEINTIQTAGTDPLHSRLVGTVHRSATGDGKVFFQSLSQVANRSVRFPTAGNGLLAVDMRQFWLGKTSSTGTTPPSISLPDGVNTLDFGGVDTNHDRVAATPTSTSDVYNVQLGLPGYGGTRVIIDRSITGAEKVTATGATTPTTIQHGVVFAVSGRLQLFQANEIDGNASLPPGQFSNENTAASGNGGTIVFAGTAGTTPYLNNADIKGAATGQIGNVRVGNNATNFTTLVDDAVTSNTNAKIANFSIGGETQNVLLVAPSGSRNVVFGKGMDTVEIRTHVIQQLQANRGALNSTVVADREINKVDLGGPVVNTSILSGYHQDFAGILSAVEGSSTSIFSSATASAPAVSTDATEGGHMTVHVAGDVTNSVFAAAVVPGANNVYGGPDQIVLPSGEIKGKIEGTVNNAAIAPDAPSQAFFAKKVTSFTGPVVPPNVPEAPYSGPSQPTHLPGIIHNKSATATAIATATSTASQVKKASTSATGKATMAHTSVVPKGPAVSRQATR